MADKQYADKQYDSWKNRIARDIYEQCKAAEEEQKKIMLKALNEIFFRVGEVTKK